MNDPKLREWAGSLGWLLVVLLLLFMSPRHVTTASAAESDSRSSSLTYEQHVRPILKTHCFHCHGEGGKREGGLDLRLRRLIALGGDSGPAVEAGDAGNSLLLERILSHEMPPEEMDHRPTDAEINLIAKWISEGAITARPEPDDADPDRYLTHEERSFWSFQPGARPELPDTDDPQLWRTPIDSFILARLQSRQLSFAHAASASTLLRRVYADLLGLPPSKSETARFLADRSPDAYDRLVDRLLASHHYGERWGRHWLDVAGYADSEGYTEDDPIRPDAHRYRDYVIRSLNSDKRFDQFIVEQLAGDELAGVELAHETKHGTGETGLSPQRIEQLTATGFLRMAPDGTASKAVDAAQARNDVIAKTLEIVSTSLLGLTVACAQCHDHRYDPIPQRDYYAFRSIFEPAFDWKNWKTPTKRRISLYTEEDRQRAQAIEEQARKIDSARVKRQQELIDAAVARELARLPTGVREAVRIARDTVSKARTAEQVSLLKKYPNVNVTAGSLYLFNRKASDELKQMADKAAKLRASKPKEEFLRALHEPPQSEPPQSFVFYRGDHEQPRQPVSPAELSVLTYSTSSSNHLIADNDPRLATSGRRLNYARWVTSGQHPLVSRVLVNRVWMRHFGRGLVATPGDFGALGTPPSHPHLLDWLATEFIRGGWSLKRLHRLMLASTTYRQSSAIRQDCVAVDADNSLRWRMTPRRLEAEVLRDSLLAVSGQLNRKSFGPPVPVMADRSGKFVIGIENLNAGRPGKEIPMGGEESRRSVYVQVRRSRPLSVMEPFDLPAMAPNCIDRTSSTVAPQSLLLMNSEFVIHHADLFARRIATEAGDRIEDRIRSAWFAVYCEPASDEEVGAARVFIEQLTDYFASSGSLDSDSKKADRKPDSQSESFATFCHALLSSNRFLYVD